MVYTFLCYIQSDVSGYCSVMDKSRHRECPVLISGIEMGMAMQYRQLNSVPTFMIRCQTTNIAWWHHRMKTLSTLLALFERNPPVTGGFPSQRPVTRSFDVFFDLRLSNWFSGQSIRRWFETPSRSLWCFCNGITHSVYISSQSAWVGIWQYF